MPSFCSLVVNRIRSFSSDNPFHIVNHSHHLYMYTRFVTSLFDRVLRHDVAIDVTHCRRQNRVIHGVSVSTAGSAPQDVILIHHDVTK